MHKRKVRTVLSYGGQYSAHLSCSEAHDSERFGSRLYCRSSRLYCWVLNFIAHGQQQCSSRIKSRTQSYYFTCTEGLFGRNKVVDSRTAPCLLGKSSTSCVLPAPCPGPKGATDSPRQA